MGLNYILLLDYKFEIPKCNINVARFVELETCAIEELCVGILVYFFYRVNLDNPLRMPG